MAKPSTSWPSSRVGVLACLLAVLVGVAGVVAQAPTWQQRSVSAPSSRNNSAAAYDVYRGVTTVFGGYNGSNTALGDTWEWNGTLWAPRITPVRPSARWGHGMVFDHKRGRAVLFGGFDGGALRSDTWEWDGSAWTQRTVPAAPSARAYFAMAYDGARGVCVLFGGQDASGAALGDTWEYDGVTWLQRSAATAPSARRSASCAWDEVRRETLLFGGGDGATVSSELWAWNGTAWSLKAAPGGPSARWAASLAFDGNCGRAVLHGGADQAFANNYGDAWAWDGVQWTQLAGASPAARHGAVQVHDAQRGQFVLWGGRDAAGFRNDTWELGPSCSRTMAVVTPPVVGQTAQFRYDYPPAAAFHFGFPLVTVRQPLAFAVPIPGFPSIGLCRVDPFTAELVPVLLDGSGSLTTTLAIPNNPALWGFEFDVQAVDLDLFTLALRWAENDLEVTTGPAPPVASFAATPTSGAAPLTVSFTNQSTYATSYAWTFGDGTSSTAANPPAKVYLGGTYTVSLTATGPGGTSTTQQQIVVSGGNAAPVASFTAMPTSGSAPLTVQFTDTSTQSPLWWLWDFDNDGVFDSTQQNPSWTYTSNGVYSVRLLVVNYLGSSTVTQINLVMVGVQSAANFTMAVGAAARTSAYTDETVTFTSASTGTITSLQWDFDNNPATVEATGSPVTRTFSGPTATTVFNVRLLATGPGGSASLTRALTIVPASESVTMESVADTSVYSLNTGASSGTSNGANPQMVCGRAYNPNSPPTIPAVDNGLRRALVRFDVANNVPAGSTMLGANLQMACTYDPLLPTGAQTVSLHRLTRVWTEGTTNLGIGLGGAATGGDATWASATSSGSIVNWTTAGGDFVAGAS
ncbi:MAG: PKD domain-containing protein, partial [Planctomycetota bacterium]